MKLGEIITGAALVAFMVALCTIESLSVGSLVTMAVSGAWIVMYSLLDEEKRMREGR